MAWLRRAMWAILPAVLLGCGLVNPYTSEFKCPPLDDGKCQGVPEAYAGALDTEAGPLTVTEVPPGDPKFDAEAGNEAQPAGFEFRCRARLGP